MRIRYSPTLFLIIVIVIFIAGCSAEKKKEELIIFAASSLTNAFEILAFRFEEIHPAVDIVINFSSSSQLATQILEGVSADIFASANDFQMNKLVAADAIFGKPIYFSSNSLTIGVPSQNPKGILSLKDLAKPSIRLVLAVPGTPIRTYSDLVIRKSLPPSDQAQVYKNLVSEEANVRQVVTKIALGEADAGIIYVTDITPDIASLVTAIPIPPENNIIAMYPIAILNQTTNLRSAEDFIQFTLSEEGQKILQALGFTPFP